MTAPGEQIQTLVDALVATGWSLWLADNREIFMLGEPRA